MGVQGFSWNRQPQKVREHRCLATHLSHTCFDVVQVYILEELLSPIVTPFILLLCVRPRAASIVDFLRMFTVEVVGVGDICSFAQMDVRKHGNSKVGAV